MKENEMKSIYYLGTEHGTNKSKSAIAETFVRYKFYAVLVEGVNDNTKLFEKEPFLVWMFKLWFLYSNKRGSEFALAHKLAKDHNIPVINIDKSLNELIEHFHKPYNNIIFILILIICTFILNIYYVLLAAFIIAFIFVEGIYFGYFLSKIGIQFRDKVFNKKINEIIESSLYERILIICGKEHTNHIKKYFEVIDLTDSFLALIQVSLVYLSNYLNPKKKNRNHGRWRNNREDSLYR